jgi:sarcosine oxidase subunit alpha
VNFRLPKQNAEWIDRDRSLRFSFEGQEYSGYAGDTITSALWANGVRLLGRSFKYHRPRGVLSLANHDVNCMVEDGAQTNIRADVTALRDNARLKAVNTFGSLDKDRGRFVDTFSKFLPVGFYYKAFHTPRQLFPYWEKKMRGMAGLGAVNPKTPHVPSPKGYDFCDVLVVGAGPAGLAAAIAAGQQGASVILVDENVRPGGSLGYQWASDPVVTATLSEQLARIAALPNVSLRTSTEAAGLYADNWVALIDARRLVKLRAKTVVVAAGAHEQPAVFGNNDVPGVMLASAAQRLIARFAVRPFRRGVVLAANSDAYRAALDLRLAGVDVAAIVDLRKEPESTHLADAAKAAGITVHQHYAVVEAVPAAKKLGIIGAMIAPLDERDSPIEGKELLLPCDGIAMSVGWAAADSLICQAGGKMEYSDRVEQFVPQTLPSDIFAAGRVNGIYALADQTLDGRRAGLAAAAYAGRYTGAVPEPVSIQGPAPSHPYPVFPHATSKNFVDFDEDVQFKDFKNAVQEGFDSIELIKRYVTVGMGPSQGKLANMNAIRILAHIRGLTIPQTGTTTARPFVHPVPFGHLAGRGFHPHRHTAMHSRHEAAGAEFMPAGVWIRPAVYRAADKTRQQTIQAEVQAVRQSVGLIDVGTLGKIDVCGPDAAELLERLYTGRFAKMKPGTTRYLLMCDESGVVVDDGVAGRLAEDRFYVTATTTGADAVYREMQRWVMLWNLDVVLANVTGHLAAMNLAGPLSREVLSALTQIPLEQEVFPYLGIREGLVAGATARVMRVGFVGELGYEIHVPSQCGGYVWDQIMEQGAKFGIRPFGVEAQRVLRMEKGHIIIGQDTDGLTHPFEAGMEWAVKLDKPFFVGQRSLNIIHKRTHERTLVGFMLPPDYGGELPKECHLVIRDQKITGRVTSVAFSPSLNRVLGMAYVAVDQSTVGSKFIIRIDGGVEIEAEVVKIPFYDPQTLRQNPNPPIAKPKEPAV